MKYIAYGSNMVEKQMAYRCPNAKLIGTGYLPNHRLEFYLHATVERSQAMGAKVPVAVWEINEADEHSLDRYEGCPAFYYKKKMKVSMKSLLDGSELGEIEAIVYIMHEERELGCPRPYYYDVCMEGYRRFGFDKKIMKKALTDSVGKRRADYFLQEAGWHE